MLFKATPRVERTGNRGFRAPPAVELINSSGNIVGQVQVADDGGFLFHVSPGIW
jgi:hypothetical protein